MGQIGKLLKRGWRVLGDIHLMDWIYQTVIPGVPSAVLSIWAAFSGLPGPIIGVIAVVSFSALFIARLAYLGQQAERAMSKPWTPIENKSPPLANVTPRAISPSKPIVGVTPEYLTQFYHDHMTAHAETLVAPYIGKWIAIQGPLKDIQNLGHFVSVSAGKDRTTPREPLLHIYFDPEWYDRLIIIPRDTEISFIGQITKVGKYDLHLEHCELIEHPSTVRAL